MPRYYCDYCDTYLTHDSPSVRKQHNAGYKHKANVRTYYQQFEEQQTQSLIDQRVKEHLGQTAAFQQQVGATFHQHLASLQSNPLRPRLPILPLPGIQAPINSPLMPGMRPPVLPRPVAGVPGYGGAPTMPSMGPPGASSFAMQGNSLPRPPMMNPQTAVSGASGTPSSNGAASMMMPGMYQTNPATSGGFDPFNVSATSGLQRAPPSGGVTAPSAANTTSQDGFTYSQTSEANH
ncbi:C2H2 and C2HC zinc fingers superfamily protein [Tasmannia lanceolata]|uniref:C2H2 and C2HC zinc fingers superfamily protein n=1 Tax=Tasmannia lanceolata TaxID=3420 RepID=UPI004062CE32